MMADGADSRRHVQPTEGMDMFTRTRRGSLLTAMIAVLVLAMGGLPAAAHEGGGAIAGSGTISPGLDLTPRTQSVTFSGSGAGVTTGSPTAGTFSCAFTGGSSAPETLAAGAGTATGNCSGVDMVTGASHSASCSVIYTRLGAEVNITGTCSGSVDGFVALTCLFQPAISFPVLQWQVQCGVVFHHVTQVGDAASTLHGLIACVIGKVNNDPAGLPACV
jgi:hypothetical protein